MINIKKERKNLLQKIESIQKNIEELNSKSSKLINEKFTVKDELEGLKMEYNSAAVIYFNENGEEFEVKRIYNSLYATIEELLTLHIAENIAEQLNNNERDTVPTEVELNDMINKILVYINKISEEK